MRIALASKKATQAANEYPQVVKLLTSLKCTEVYVMQADGHMDVSFKGGRLSAGPRDTHAQTVEKMFKRDGLDVKFVEVTFGLRNSMLFAIK